MREARRGLRRAVWVTGLALMVAFGSSTAWWVLRGGEPVDHALSVEVPDGTRLMYEERFADEANGTFTAAYLASSERLSELMDRYGAIARETNEEARRFELEDGTIVTLSPARDIPATRLSPVHPVTEEVPLGTRGWIVIEHGQPPASTTTIAVPPMGES